MGNKFSVIEFMEKEAVKVMKLQFTIFLDELLQHPNYANVFFYIVFLLFALSGSPGDGGRGASRKMYQLRTQIIILKTSKNKKCLLIFKTTSEQTKQNTKAANVWL